MTCKRCRCASCGRRRRVPAAVIGSAFWRECGRCLARTSAEFAGRILRERRELVRDASRDAARAVQGSLFGDLTADG